MQGIESTYPQRHGKGIQSSRQYRLSKVHQSDSSYEPEGRLHRGNRRVCARVTGSKSRTPIKRLDTRVSAPKRGSGATIFGK